MKASVFAALLLTACACTVPAKKPDSSAISVAETTPDMSQGVDAAPTVVAHSSRVSKINLVGEVDEASADAFEEALKAANGEAVLVEINGPGGDVDAGWRIMRAIESDPRSITCVVDEMAASMDMLILESCDVRAMTVRAVLMAHEIRFTGQFSGHPNDWQAMADRARVQQEALLEQYVRRSKVTIEEMRKRTDGGRQWWVGWREALERGFVDHVVANLSR